MSSRARRKYAGFEGLILTKEEKESVRKEVGEWLTAYPWLDKPATKAMVEKVIETQKRLDRLAEWIDTADVPAEEKHGAAVYYKDLLTTWKGMMTTLGVTFTAQQYFKTIQKTGMSPEEILKKIAAEKKAAEEGKS